MTPLRDYHGCFTSPGGLTMADSFPSLTLDACQSICTAQGHSVFALRDHNGLQCWCGDAVPSADAHLDAKCSEKPGLWSIYSILGNPNNVNKRHTRPDEVFVGTTTIPAYLAAAAASAPGIEVYTRTDSPIVESTLSTGFNFGGSTATSPIVTVVTTATTSAPTSTTTLRSTVTSTPLSSSSIATPGSSTAIAPSSLSSSSSVSHSGPMSTASSSPSPSATQATNSAVATRHVGLLGMLAEVVLAVAAVW